MHRRDLLKLLSLSTLAVTAAPLLAACGSGPGGRTPSGGDVELVAADVARSTGDPAAVPSVVAAMHATGGALYGSLAEEPGNLTISPYSVSAALALAANGAKGTTLDQLELVFGGTDIETVNGGLNALTTHLESLAGEVTKSEGTTTELVLDAANALFGQRGFAWGAPFLETLAASYGAGVHVVDWSGATEAARQAVNAWTAEQTRDKIPEILAPDSVGPDTRLVLVNTLYLKAPWDRPFDRGRTKDGAFTLLDDTEVDVPLMTSSDPVGDAYAAGAGWTAARLAYAGGEVAMTIVVPDPGRFEQVEQDVVSGQAGTYLDALRPEQVVVTLPSWTFRSHSPLVGPLRDLGVVVPFTPAADLSAMTGDDTLSIGAVEHEVFIAVDEQGTEATAATAVVAGVTSAPPAYTTLVVDRPFLFVVHDVEHGIPLFLGRVVDPRG
ncbi:serpin family protein [Nocardioides plantarum]|uniref:Serpin family protein n=1 Tax=Nocardioides plantarum TaxID=29299 RepID=A0ABV5KA13_9ACTN|nr:serpin family protein [Nocardioides plantarum]